MLWSLIVAGVTVLLLALHLHHRKRKLDIPGPYQLPILCNLIDTFRHKHRLQDYMLEQASKSPKGTFHFVLPFGGDTDVMVTDPPSVEYILKTNFENFTKGPHFKDKLQTLLGDGIFNTDGQPWKEQRQIASHMFKVKELKHMRDIFERHGRELLQILDKAADTGVPIDVADLFFRYTLDSIGEIAFGFNVDSMHKDCSFSQAFDAAQECAVDRFLWPFWKFTPSPMGSYVKILNDFAANLIKERRQDPDVRDRNDLLSRYMCMDGVDHSDAHLRDIVMNFMIAGRDTTAQTLSWLFYNLSRNPDKEAELLKEIDSFDDGLPDYDELRHMKYIMGAINETLRLCPPVPVDPKYVVKDDVLPNGYKVPAGVNVAWSMYCMGRMEKYWDRPLEFLPERWLDPEKNKERHPFLFIPFQAGPRTCLGQNMAYLEAKVMTFMILKSYRLELHDPENQKVTYRPSDRKSVV